MESMMVDLRCTRKRQQSTPSDVPRDWLPDEPGPFLGQLIEGETQPALINSLFRAPLFRRENTQQRDFLLHRVESSSAFTLTPISNIWVCGQTEPQGVCVPVPFPKVLRFQEMVLAWGISKTLTMDPISMKDVRSAVLSPYSLAHRKKLVAKCDELVERMGRCVKKPDKDEGKEYGKYVIRNKTLPLYFRPDSLLANISPEHVCAEESSLAAEYQLQKLGLTSFPSLEQVAAWLSRMHQLKLFKENRAKATMQSVSSNSRLVRFLVRDLVQLEKRIEKGQFIFNHLSLAPWNTTSTFFVTQVEPDNKGNMEIASANHDDVFRHVRVVSSTTKSAAAPPEVDLRKLTTKEALRILKQVFQVPRQEMDQLLLHGNKRWAIINRVRELSTSVTQVVGKDNNPLASFARGLTSSSTQQQQQQQQFISKCNKIWKCQKDRCLSMALLQTAVEEKKVDTPPVGDDEDRVLKYLQTQAAHKSELEELRSMFSSSNAAAPASPAAAAAPPQKVVRRSVRQVLDNGTEKITFQFLFGENDLKRASKHQKQRVKK
jgi:hypothetical protein